MSAVAQFACWQGCRVTGSDRLTGSADTAGLVSALARAGCAVFPQDGSGVAASRGAVVVSTAIEQDNPDIAAARSLRLPVFHRSQVLAALAASAKTIAIAGTSGKSTVTALCFELLRGCGMAPSLITGARVTSLVNAGLAGNAFKGGSDLLVIEADESDGSLVNYHPCIGVFLNVSKDHKEIPETVGLFGTLAAQSRVTVVNRDDPGLAGLKATRTFGMRPGADVCPDAVESVYPKVMFSRGGIRYTLNQPGEFNLQNALAALAVCECAGCDPRAAASALQDCRGLERRFQAAGTAGGVTVIDDFAHNPEKIRAALKTARLAGDRVIAVFQPHGFGPIRFMRHELVRAFRDGLRNADLLYLLPIYYAGGTAHQDIASADLAAPLLADGMTVCTPDTKPACVSAIAAAARRGDVVLSMGARDPALPAFARDIVSALTQQSVPDR